MKRYVSALALVLALGLGLPQAFADLKDVDLAGTWDLQLVNKDGSLKSRKEVILVDSGLKSTKDGGTTLFKALNTGVDFIGVSYSPTAKGMRLAWKADKLTSETPSITVVDSEYNYFKVSGDDLELYDDHGRPTLVGRLVRKDKFTVR